MGPSVHFTNERHETPLGWRFAKRRSVANHPGNDTFEFLSGVPAERCDRCICMYVDIYIYIFIFNNISK